MQCSAGLRTLTGSPDERVRVRTGEDGISGLAARQDAYLARRGLARVQVLMDTGCNASCVHCFLGTKRPVGDLSTVERMLAEQLPAAGLESTIYFSEPFHRGENDEGSWRRIEETVRLVARYQPQLLLTNGLGVDRDVIDLLVETGSFRIYLPLLAASAATHDRITRVPGSFRQVRRVLRLLGDPACERIAVCTVVVLHRANVDELQDMLEIAADASAVSAFLMAMHPGPRPSPEMDDLAFTAHQRRMLLPVLGAARARFQGRLWIEFGSSWGPNFHTGGIYRHLYQGRPYCPAGRTMVAVHPATGVVYPCMKLSGREEYAIGTWDPEAGRPAIDPDRNVLGRLSVDPSPLRGACSPDRCAYSPICRGGCRALAAEYSGGDLLAEMPGCLTAWIGEDDAIAGPCDPGVPLRRCEG